MFQTMILDLILKNKKEKKNASSYYITEGDGI